MSLSGGDAVTVLGRTFAIISHNGSYVAVVRIRAQTLAVLVALYGVASNKRIVRNIAAARRWFQDALVALHRLEDMNGLPTLDNLQNLNKMFLPILTAVCKMPPIAVGTTSLLLARTASISNSLAGAGLSALVRGRSWAARMTLIGALASGPAAAVHYRRELTKLAAKLGEGSDLERTQSFSGTGVVDKEWSMQLATKLRPLPSAFWFWAMVSSAVLLQGVKEAGTAGMRRLVNVPIWATASGLALYGFVKRRELSSKMPSRNSLSMAFTPRSLDVEQTDEVGDSYLETVVPMATALGSMPLASVVASSVVAFRASVVLHALGEATIAELLRTQSITARAAFALTLAPGWMVALWKRREWLETDSSDSVAAEEELFAARLVRRFRRVPPAFWSLAVVSGTATIQAAKSAIIRLESSSFLLFVLACALCAKPKLVLGALASAGNGLSTMMTALLKRREPEALKLRDDQETFEKLLTDLNEKHMLSVMKSAPLLLKVPPEAAISVAFLGLQSVLAANGVAETAVAKLWWSSSISAQAIVAVAVAPGLALLARYGGVLAAEQAAGDEDAGAVEEATHRMIELADKSRQLPPAFWVAASISGTVTLQVAKEVASGLLAR